MNKTGLLACVENFQKSDLILKIRLLLQRWNFGTNWKFGIFCIHDYIYLIVVFCLVLSYLMRFCEILLLLFFLLAISFYRIVEFDTEKEHDYGSKSCLRSENFGFPFMPFCNLNFKLDNCITYFGDYNDCEFYLLKV